MNIRKLHQLLMQFRGEVLQRLDKQTKILEEIRDAGKASTVAAPPKAVETINKPEAEKASNRARPNSKAA